MHKNAFTASQKVVEDIDTDTDESRKVNSRKWTAESKQWKVYNFPKKYIAMEVDYLDSLK